MTASTVLASGGQYFGDAGDFLLINRFARRIGWLHRFMAFYAETLGDALCVLSLAYFVAFSGAAWLKFRRADIAT